MSLEVYVSRLAEPLTPQEQVVITRALMKKMRGLAGESAGHEFHGNQWTSGTMFASKDEADAWGTKNQPWVDKMTPDEEHALQMYTTVVGINDKLRGNKPLGTNVAFHTGSWDTPDDQRSFVSETSAVAGLDKLFARPEAVLQEDVVTYRAWMGSRALGQRQIGSEFVDKGFTSTAMARSETEAFRTDPNTGRSKNLVDVEIRVPKGIRALYVGTKPENKSWYADSSELLLNRGTRYRVISTNYGRAKRAVLEVVR